jgi:hypothetical protein
VQLLALKTFCKNETLLRISNLWNNNSIHHDVYEFLQFNLKELIPEDSVHISRALIKTRVMPGVYGQKLLTFIKLADEIAASNS